MENNILSNEELTKRELQKEFQEFYDKVLYQIVMTDAHEGGLSEEENHQILCNYKGLL